MQDGTLRRITWWATLLFCGAFWAVVIGSCAKMARASLVSLRISTPCLNADSLADPFNFCSAVSLTPLHNLDAIQIWAQPCGRTDSIFIATVPAWGKECDTMLVDVDFPPGHTYWVWTRTHKTNGLRSLCRGPQLTVAVPTQP